MQIAAGSARAATPSDPPSEPTAGPAPVIGAAEAVIVALVRERTGVRSGAVSWEPLPGSALNRAARLAIGGERFFVKLNDAARLSMLEAEADGLEAIARTNTVRVPTVVGSGAAGGQAFLVLEHLAFGRGGDGVAAELGRGLAALHRVHGSRYGWHRDNTIGTTPQINAWGRDWLAFFAERRLRFQLGCVAGKGFGDLARRGERLLARLPERRAAHDPPPSLLHGDLWGGNWGALVDGEPVIFDPAVYYGDREADLAMTELFGGFPKAFYAAYAEAYPLAAGYEWRRDLYNLYHLLNHVNLFGAGYARQAAGLVDRLLDALG